MIEGTRLSELRERIRRIEQSKAAVHGVLPFGVVAIDRVLPGGGLETHVGYRQNRDLLMRALAGAGPTRFAPAEGAFYTSMWTSQA